VLITALRYFPAPLSLLSRINRPEYVFSPAAAIKRLRLGSRQLPGSGPSREVRLHWGQTITVFPDWIGRVLVISGIFDVCLTESVHRLLDPGGLVVDVGANVGYVTNLMATRTGPGGRVVAFEPHPAVFEILQRNVTRWNADTSIGEIVAHRLAVSNRSGAGRLSDTGEADGHMGLASLRRTNEADGPGDFDVELATIDETVDDRHLQLLKIDVEGHEAAALEGAEKLLSQQRVRDVVFEDHGVYPTPAMTLLEGHGMTLFTLTHSLLGPRARPVQEGPAQSGWPGPNYLATFEPARAIDRLGPRGWRSLGRESGSHRSSR
jgi:FkbM family methyltransferase